MMHIAHLCSVLASKQQDPELTCFLKGMTESNNDRIMPLLPITWVLCCLAENHLKHFLNKESSVVLKVFAATLTEVVKDHLSVRRVILKSLKSFNH